MQTHPSLAANLILLVTNGIVSHAELIPTGTLFPSAPEIYLLRLVLHLSSAKSYTRQGEGIYAGLYV